MSTFNSKTYSNSDPQGKRLLAEFLRQLKFDPKTPKESFKDGDVWAYVPALERNVVFGAEYRGKGRRLKRGANDQRPIP